MIYILSWTTKKHFKKTLSRPLLSKLKKIQGLFETVQYETVFKTSTKTATWLFFYIQNFIFVQKLSPHFPPFVFVALETNKQQNQNKNAIS